MTFDELSRSNIQALFRYMPGQPYNWSAKATVIGRPPRQTSDLDIPEDWAKPQLRRLIRPFVREFRGSSNGPELEIVEKGRFEIIKAEALQAERFPNTFLCKQCGRFQSVRTGDHPRCDGHGPMDQFPWAEIHECGHLRELTAPGCPNGCRAPMALRNTKAFFTSRWFWQCTHCNVKPGRPVANWCGTCRSARAELVRLPQSRAHYPQHITLINPPTRDTYRDLSNDSVHRAAVAQALGTLPPGVDGLQQAVRGHEVGDPADDAEHIAARLGVDRGDPMYDEIMKRAAKKRRDDQLSAEEWGDRVDRLGRKEQVIDALGEECLQYTLARNASELTSDELVKEFDGDPLVTEYNRYGSLFARYGLSEVTLIRKLPMAFVVAGYSRQDATAIRTTKRGQTPVAFRFFDPLKNGRFPMYGVRTETEALLFQLDLVKMVRWLVDSGVADDARGIDTQADAQRWLFERVQPIVDLFHKPEDEISHAVLGLVHSFAHRAMKSLASRSGLHADSMAEYLFPARGAFLLYANTRSDFTLGGLEYVYRYDLRDALEELDTDSRCMFDPPCRNFRDGAACAACLHMSEVACARFNTVLDRNMLFGAVGNVDHNEGRTRWQAYWSR
ncbi:hypothetical protein ACIG3E_08385 [Streptomyces sp. NPDC053474]|uniref:hypothetical protein n=1 Tax=Streptomyces sp. NPDC053474 TaxID=3365704 RepID=UPI0037D62218